MNQEQLESVMKSLVRKFSISICYYIMYILCYITLNAHLKYLYSTNVYTGIYIYVSYSYVFTSFTYCCLYSILVLCSVSLNFTWIMIRHIDIVHTYKHSLNKMQSKTFIKHVFKYIIEIRKRTFYNMKTCYIYGAH